ncbi:MAG: DEAD/DEAH box helicase [Spirochaetaceae bacterium]|jgi:superfamily II DNA/RNA helicase|nr:DEAD/DEAH box helicase [Spirochaetaceae bacterium]
MATNASFSYTGLGTAPFFIQRLAERGIQTPTEIQSLVIPRLASGENVLFHAPTGTGKTFAYLLPLLERLLRLEEGPSAGATGPRLVILAPTLELCSQIKAEGDFLLPESSEKRRLHLSLIIGSANMHRQIETLKKEKPPVIVGNPARLLQLFRMGKLKLKGVQALVLDEGDRLIADELAGATQDLVREMNPHRQTTACSATLSVRSQERLLPLMGEPLHIVASEEQEILRERIQHWALFSPGRKKIAALGSLLAATTGKKVLIFSRPGAQVGNIVSKLQYHRIATVGLYGEMDKKTRVKALDDFRTGRARVLVASDLAARGLDIPRISHVVALDVGDPEEYIHRAGRTGRAGLKGIMITLGDEEELRRLAVLEKKLGIVVYPKVLYAGRLTVPPPV